MAPHFLYYNFVRIHKTHKTTPAMVAGVTDRLWEVADMVTVLEAWEAHISITCPSERNVLRAPQARSGLRQ